MLAVHNVSKSFDGTLALAPTSLEFAAGRTTVLLGPSGCGKTTLLKLLLGLLVPDGGEVRFHGAPVTPARVDALRHRAGYVIQEGGLFPHLSARDNVCLMARHLGRDSAWIERRITELSDLARLPAESLSRFPGELSGGQRQRVALMRGLMLDPDVLLLDEPLGALDPMTRHQLQLDLKAIFGRLARTVVLVTHDMHEAAWFADEIVLMRAGRVVQRGALEDLLQRPAEGFVTEFVRAQRADPRLAAG
ncbi:MAG TPA: ATP-binding cassette domain-containing protein [Burkholderiales bacterium]|nr:ATP-binding cassette domain-containing protein [Burkholderiales bacterium]